MKKIYLSHTNKKLGGVLGGMGEALDVDPTILRLIVVFLALITAVVPALVTYLIAWLIIPDVPVTVVKENQSAM